MGMCDRTARVARLLCGATVAFAAFTPPASAQVLADTEVRTVEVIGLKRWTPEMIADSLARYSPGDSLHSHACAAALRYRLGFAEAASTVFRSGGKPYVLVSLVEPQDSARIRHRYIPLDTTTFREEWAGVVDVIRTRPDLFILAVSRYGPGGISAEDRELPAHAGRDSALVHRVWEFLAAHRREEDFETSTHILAAGDPALYDRMVAAAILSNFSDRDRAWWVLADALRESDGPVKATAGTVLASRAWAEPRDVDWGPAASTIHALLNGTGLFELRAVLAWLPRMGASPRWSAAFLAGGGEMVLAYLQAEHPPTRDLVHQFLIRMSGMDLGIAVEPWRAWIASLDPVGGTHRQAP